jgi:GTPase SAR1 family protein
MIQKKVCMVGVQGTGKTSLVQQFVHSMFSDRYLSTVGVKIDRKALDLDGTPLTIVLWDLAGRDGQEDITTSYLRGAHAILYVADGTRKETCDQLALNKIDLTDRWALDKRYEETLAREWDLVRTSAKSGTGVEEAFQRLGRATLATKEARS